MADDAARRYHRLQLLLALAGLLVGLAYLVAVLLTGVARPLVRLAGGVSTVRAWEVAVVALVLGGAYRLLTFPLAWVSGYWLPRRYDLLHQSLPAWLGDRLKAALLGGALALLTLEVIYALLATSPLWWIGAAAVLILIQVLVALVFPVWVLPLFYRLAPLTDETLRRRLVDLASRAGIPVVAVWVADQSRKSRTANAALAGLGRTRRILLFDTLVARFTPDEIEAILAHELGHHVHADVWRGLAVQAAVTVGTLAIADRLLRLGVDLFDLADVADPAGLPWLALVVAGLSLLAAPLLNTYSRRVERQADDFAIASTGNVAGFVGAMERLAALNLAERRPARLKEILLHSHPAIERRIARATRADSPSTA